MSRPTHKTRPFDKSEPRDEPQRRELANPLLSIVLPVYNEVHILPQLTALLIKAARLCGPRYEIIFVNDGSTDGSQRVLDLLGAESDEIRVIHLSRNFGHQAAVQAGLCHARGDAVVLMDSDLQDSPTAIPQFFQKWLTGYDVVYAIRARRKEGPVMRLLFAGFHHMISRISATPIPADAGLFGLVDRRVAREIAALSERDRYLPGLRSWVGFRQTGVVVERLARYDRQPRVSMRGLWRLAKTAVFGFSTLPLFIFHAIGLLALAVFVCVGGFALYCRLFTETAIPGWTSHVLSATFFGALNALGISILGEYVTRIYDQVRERPLYLVDRTVNLLEASPGRSTPNRGDERELSIPAPESAASAELLADFLGVLSAEGLLEDSWEAEGESDAAEEPDADDLHYLGLLEEANSLLCAVSRARLSESAAAPTSDQAEAADPDIVSLPERND